MFTSASSFSQDLILGSSAFIILFLIIWGIGQAHSRRRNTLALTNDTNRETLGRPISKTGNATYVSTFPPSQRSLIHDTSKSGGGFFAGKELLKIDDDYRLASSSTYIFSGFSIADIKRLGDFPDYAKLSGVPLPSPLPKFDISCAVARPYRPFRWEYHQTMSFKKMDPDFWIELESTYRERIRQREDIYAKHGDEVLQALPGSELACKELMEMVIQFICARYPRQFLLEGHMFTNHILGTKTNLKTIPPLHFLLKNVPEDFSITLRDEKTGKYILRAGIICSSIGWCLGGKIGKGLSEIHAPVPDYKEKMEFSMDRFFTKMPTFKPIQRGSWGLSSGQPLYLPPHHPNYSRLSIQDPLLKPEDVHLRVDWQTLRRLPLSGGIVFGFKAFFTPITEFQDEPFVPSLVLKILSDGKPSLLANKGTWYVEHVAKPLLKQYEAQQIENGMIQKFWAHETLDESPFFPDWKNKWTGT